MPRTFSRLWLIDFSLNHALPYSIIGVQCILLGGTLFPKYYWQTACLLQYSGALDGKNTDYNKLAKAIADLQEQGVKIKPPNINISKRDFTLEANTETIYFGFGGIKGLKTAIIEKIFELRPFEDIYDFYNKVKPDAGSLTALVKAGVFYESGERDNIISFLAEVHLERKNLLLKKINGQNFLRISREGLWPMNTPELKLSRRVFNFTRYLSQFELEEGDWPLDETAAAFLDDIEYPHGDSLNKAEWKEVYNIYLEPMKEYVAAHQEELLNKINQNAINSWKTKYFNSTAKDEIETLGITFKEHPFNQIKKNVVPLSDIPEEPQIEYTFQTKEGRIIPLYKLFMICGLAIAKDKQHHIVTILTPQGPIDVKFTKEGYAHYDSQISKIEENGKKKIVERSWFNRGEGLLIHGLKRNGVFIPKKYKKSPMKHTVYKITSVEGGKPELQKERKVGNRENDDGKTEFEG